MIFKCSLVIGQNDLIIVFKGQDAVNAIQRRLEICH